MIDRSVARLSARSRPIRASVLQSRFVNRSTGSIRSPSKSQNGSIFQLNMSMGFADSSQTRMTEGIEEKEKHDVTGEEKKTIKYAFTPPPPLSNASRKKVDSIFKKVLWLDMIELHLLTELIHEKMGVKSSEDVNASDFQRSDASSASSTDNSPAEKLLKDIKLIGYDPKAKIKVIKEVRAIGGFGLKEAKELVESLPKVIQRDLKDDKAEELKAQLEAVGAQVELV